jgi:hypothetical protein
MLWPSVVAKWLARLLSIQNIQGSNLVLQIGSFDYGFRDFSHSSLNVR